MQPPFFMAFAHAGFMIIVFKRTSPTRKLVGSNPVCLLKVIITLIVESLIKDSALNLLYRLSKKKKNWGWLSVAWMWCCNCCWLHYILVNIETVLWLTDYSVPVGLLTFKKVGHKSVLSAQLVLSGVSHWVLWASQKGKFTAIAGLQYQLWQESLWCWIQPAVSSLYSVDVAEGKGIWEGFWTSSVLQPWLSVKINASVILQLHDCACCLRKSHHLHRGMKAVFINYSILWEWSSTGECYLSW